MARPQDKYTPELALEICSKIANGTTVTRIVKEYKMGLETFYSWIRKHPEFAKMYADAKSDWVEGQSEAIIDIAKDGSGDYDQETGMFNKENVQRSRLIVDTLKWKLAHEKPSKYGASTQIKHADADGGKLGLKDILGVLDGRSASLPDLDE